MSAVARLVPVPKKPAASPSVPTQPVQDLRPQPQSEVVEDDLRAAIRNYMHRRPLGELLDGILDVPDVEGYLLYVPVRVLDRIEREGEERRRSRHRVFAAGGRSGKLVRMIRRLYEVYQELATVVLLSSGW
jgi:hypothetical protein